MSDDDPYVYPGTQILRNKLDIHEAAELARVERRLVAVRVDEGTPRGNFDLEHLKAMHHHLFQDVYEWAGQVRTVEIAKGGDQFQFRQFIETGMADVHRRLVAQQYLEGTSRQDFAAGAGRILGDINYIHPFREGNGRTQLQYLQQLGERAGHSVDLERLQRQANWIQASREAHQARYDPMARSIEASISVEQQRESEQTRAQQTEQSDRREELLRDLRETQQRAETDRDPNAGDRER